MTVERQGNVRSRRDLLRLSVRGAVCLFVTSTGLAACDTPRSSSRCVFVEQRHLARQRDGSSRTRICNPQQVNARYRERYFPGYEWGDPR